MQLENIFTLSGFADEISPDPDEQLRVLRECDIRFLDLRKVENINVLDLSPEQIRGFQKKLTENNIRVACIGSPIGKVDIMTDDLDAHYRRFQIALERARQFETPYIRIFSFHHEGYPAAQCRDAVFRQMDRMVRAAARAGLILLHENEKNVYGDSAARCRELLDEFSSPNFEGIFDPANFIQCGEEIADAWPLLRDQSTYFHIKDASKATRAVVPPGEGDGQLEEILNDARTRGFNGFISLEPHLKAEHGTSGADRFTLAANALKAILERLP